MAREYALPTDPKYRDSGFYKLFVERHELAQQLVSGYRVLDTCCATGWGTHHFIASKASWVCGIDVSSDALQTYRLHTKGLPLAQMDALRLAYPDRAFDVVLALESIEHFTQQDSQKYVAELCRVTRPGGVLLGTTPLCPDASLIPAFQAQNQFHLYAYTRPDLHRLLKGSFTQIDIYEAYSQPSPYLIFLAQRKGHPLLDTTDLRRKLAARQLDSRKLKTTYYSKWSRTLGRLGDRKNARRLAVEALSWDPCSFSLLWAAITGGNSIRAVISKWLPPRFRKWLRSTTCRFSRG